MSFRKILKLNHLSKDERAELKCELGYYKYELRYKTRKCPICGIELYSNSWSEEMGCVETIERCGSNYPPGTHYAEHWSYGLTELTAGEFRARYTHSTSDSEVLGIRARWQAAIIVAKAGRKRQRRLSHRKNKSQRKRGV